MELKFSIRESQAPGETIIEKMENLAELGFSGIEITSTPAWDVAEEVRDAAETTGIVPNIWSAEYLNILDPRPAERERAVASMRNALTVCGEAGGIGVICVPLIWTKMRNLPRIPDLSPLKSTAELEFELLVAELSDLADHAQEVGADIIIEPLNRYEMWWPNTLQDGVEICEAVGKDGVSIMADFFHMNIEEAHISESIRSAGGYIKNVHLADSQRKIPGFGHTDFGPGLKALDEIGYDCYLGFEAQIPGDPMEELPKSMDYIRQAAGQ
ncbi:MAG: sugar phosphate isomerase/epimerase family protein [Armatimonadota bacterium]